MISKEEKTLAMLIYLISYFTVFIGPVIIWILKKDESEFIDYHGKEYLNFLISITVYSIISGLFVLILIGILMLAIVGVAGFILTIIAAIKAYDGEYYKFPLIFRLIK
ncbi:hypothetical protein CR203_10155 [Salipaludibacillus neizhouensis]|uniref:DUF4870 domain-containing protein n=1 Tax=Salipaludibacillus neizhouensis TaxID=885475 RepID=A0A3A9KB55_9BACI|nr:DUF4870 domain-containing protein [Salipaludibacillus neizhouensis]RKL67701.1 hypothetical protein CR203_10155 [Salipaludibacillus neizhouensis]